MKKIVAYLSVAAFLSACASTTPLETRLSKLGEEPADARDQYMYGLPLTVLKVEITYRESVHVPGPFGDYAERYLGISEVIRQKSTEWQLADVEISPFTEPDPDHFYSLNIMDGEFSRESLDRLVKEGVLMDGTERLHKISKGEGLEFEQQADYLRYVDLGV